MALDFETPSRASAVVDYIEGLIQERSLEPGERIATKAELQREIGVARATINEAIRMLHDRGRVTTLSGPKGGIFVADGNPEVQLGRFLLAVGNDAKTVGDAITLRDFLETLVMSDALQHRTEKDIQELYAYLERMGQVSSTIPLVLEEVWKLHKRIAAISPNQILESTYSALVDFIAGHVRGLPGTPGQDPEAFAKKRLEIHRELVEVIESGDQSRLQEVLDRHNETPRESMPGVG